MKNENLDVSVNASAGYKPSKGFFSVDVRKEHIFLSNDAKWIFGVETNKITKQELLSLLSDDATNTANEILSLDHYEKQQQAWIDGLSLQRPKGEVSKVDITLQLIWVEDHLPTLTGMVSVSNATSLLPEITNSSNSETVTVILEVGNLNMISIEGSYDTIFDYSKQDFEKEGFWMNQIHQDFREMFVNELQTLSAKSPTKVIQYKFRFACGEFHWVQSRLTHFFQSGNEQSLIEMVTFDIENYQQAFDKIIEEGNFNKQLIQHLSHVFFLVSPSGKFVRWNDRLNAISGYTNEEIAGMNPTDFFPSQAKEELQKLISEVYSKGRVETEAIFIAKNGDAKPVLLIGSTVVYNGEVCMSGVGIDISSQKKLIHEQTRLKERMEHIFNSSLDVICSLNQLGQIETMNRAAEFVFGYEPDIMVGRNIIEFVCPDDQDGTFAVLKKIASGHLIQSFENCCLKHSGEVVHLLWSVNWSADESILYCVAKDVTEMKKAQAELKMNEQRFRMLVQEGSDLIAIVDFEGVYSYVSSNYLNILGYRDSELIGYSGFDFIHPKDQKELKELFGQILELGKIESPPYRFRDKAGTYRWMRTIATVIDVEGNPEIIINSTDVSKIIEIQERLNYTNQWYEQVNILTQDVLYDWNMLSDSIVWSDEFFRKFGYTTNEITSYNQFIQLEHREDELAQRDAWKQFIAQSNRFEWRSEIRIKHKDGNYLFVQDIGFVIRNQKGKPLRMIGVMRDITDQKSKEIKNELLDESRAIFSQDHTLETVINNLCDFLLVKTNALCIEFWMNSEEKAATALFAYRVDASAESAYLNVGKKNNVFECGEGLPGKAWMTNEILVWENIKEHPDFIRTAFAKEQNIQTGVAIPLRVKGRSIGQLVLLFKQGRPSILDFYDFFDELVSHWANEIYRKRQEEEFRMLFESSPDIMAVVGGQGRFLRVNPAFCELLGYTFEELTSATYASFLHPDDLAKTALEFQETISAERKSSNYVNRYRMKSGGYRYISWSSSDTFGSDGLVFAYGRDVTEVMELQRLLDDATELAKVAGWEIDSKTNMVHWSRKVNDILGATISETISELLHTVNKEFRRTLHNQFKNCLIQGDAFDSEVIVATHEGEKWFRIIGQSETIEDNTRRVFGSIQDIHERKVMELQLTSLNSELIHNMKELEKVNNELEQFAFVASHDLQEPLRMVTGFLTLLDKRYGEQLDEKAKSYIDFAVDGSTRMRSIILDLLEFSRAGKLDEDSLVGVDIKYIVNDVLTLLNNTIVSLEATINVGELPVIKAIPAQMRQVFQNLISNALKYRSKQRNVIVSIGSYTEEDETVIFVKDNGIGIDEIYHEKIFEIFKRLHTKEEYEGTGIGLSITKKIIDSMGWQLEVISEPDCGAEFRITIPK
jgi:PAS domain S-box-containing protein